VTWRRFILTWLRDWRFWGAVWLAGLVVAGVVLLWDARSWLDGSPAASFRTTLLNKWPVWVLWWVVAPAILWLQHRLTLLDRHWPWAIALHTLMAFLVTGLFILVAGMRLLIANHLPWSFLPVILHDLRVVGRWDYTPLLIYFMAVSVLYAAGYHRQWRAGQLLTGELRVANARLETRLVRASLDALKMQLHPHFLFNTLNSITSLIRNNRTREAEDVVAGLGELLRRALEHRQEAQDTLEHELEFLRRYFEIESIRFQDRLQVEYDIAPDCLPALVPCLMLQPLAENAMKHGISRRSCCDSARAGRRTGSCSAFTTTVRRSRATSCLAAPASACKTPAPACTCSTATRPVSSYATNRLAVSSPGSLSLSPTPPRHDHDHRPHPHPHRGRRSPRPAERRGPASFRSRHLHRRPGRQRPAGRRGHQGAQARPALPRRADARHLRLRGAGQGAARAAATDGVRYRA
jgi:two-component system, LytTR family, sensor kinase